MRSYSASPTCPADTSPAPATGSSPATARGGVTQTRPGAIPVIRRCNLELPESPPGQPLGFGLGHPAEGKLPGIPAGQPAQAETAGDDGRAPPGREQGEHLARVEGAVDQDDRLQVGELFGVAS